MKKRNPIARVIADRRFSLRVVKPKKGKGAYKRCKSKTIVKDAHAAESY